MSHTPGPWIVESDGSSVAMGDQVVIVAPAPDGAGRDVERANARLIAAAPELLESLQRLAWIARYDMSLGNIDLPQAWEQALAVADAAIAKAEGKS